LGLYLHASAFICGSFLGKRVFHSGFPFGGHFVFRMTTMTDHDLLQQYAETGAQEAFADLVSHHSDWIYSAALRLVRRRDWAEDVTQAVFIVLSRRVKTVPRATLGRWLFKVTRYCASDILRQENRRERREKEAAAMKSQVLESGDDATWEEMSPILEQTVAALGGADRDVVLLRFYQQKSMAEIGRVLGISEDAARKRVAKAVEKMRTRIMAHGVLVPGVQAAMTLLAERTTHAGPAGLGASCVPGASSAAATHVAANVNHMLLALKLKLAAAAIVMLAMIPAAAWVGVELLSAPQQATTPPVASPAQTQTTAAESGASAVLPAVGGSNVAADDAAVAPLCTSLTRIIVSLNFSMIELEALKAEENRAIAAFVPASDPRMPMVRANLNEYNIHIAQASAAMSAARVGHFYPMVAQLSAKNIAGFFVVPAEDGVDVAAIDRFMQSPAATVPNGKVRVYGGKGPPTWIVAQMSRAKKLPEFSDAMSSGPDAAVRVVVNAEFVGELVKVISTPRTLGLGDMSEDEWAGAKWFRMSITAPPKLSGTLVIECSDEQSAAALEDLLTRKFAALYATGLNAGQAKDPISGRIAELIGDVKPVVSSKTITIELDEKIMEPVLVDWYLSVMPKGENAGRASKPVQHAHPAQQDGM
jgi:RNA polymerase sigma factor (sigma-70 family)